MDPLIRTWAWLLALTAGTTALAGFGGPGWLASGAIVALAFLKARAILRDFLHLAQAPAWLAGALAVIAAWLTAIWALHLAG